MPASNTWTQVAHSTEPSFTGWSLNGVDVVRAANNAQRKIVSLLQSTTAQQTFLSTEQLPMLFAAAVNAACKSVVGQLRNEMEKYARLNLHMGNGAVRQLHQMYKVSPIIAQACPPEIRCAVEWTPPMQEENMQRLRCELQQAQVKLMQLWGVSAKFLKEDPRKRLNQLAPVLMQHYKKRLAYIEGNEAVECAKMVKLVNDLKPKYALVYEVSGFV